MYIENICLVSFCVPCYKVPIDKVRRCLDSIEKCGLGFLNYEVIVVDDGDTTEDFKNLLVLIREFKDRGMTIKVVNHAKNMSLFEARKSAVHVASGKYICHIDSDDYITPDTLSKFPKFYTENEDKWDIIQLDFNTIGNDSEIGIEKPSYDADEIIASKSLLKSFIVGKKMPGYIWGKLIAKRVCDIAYPKMPDVYVNFSEDYLALVFITTYAKTYKQFKKLKFYNYVRTEDSMTSHANKISIGKWRNLLTVKNVISITSPEYFTDKEVSESIAQKHLSLLFELWSTLTLDEMFEPGVKEQALNEFINAFGKDIAVKLNEAFEKQQKEYLTSKEKLSIEK